MFCNSHLIILSPGKIYSKISSSNKVHFWSLTVSCVVTVITFFIGIVYQFFIIDSSDFEKQQLIHLNLIKELGPIFNSYDEAEKSLITLHGIITATDYEKKNKDFVEYTDTLFANVIEFSSNIKDNSTIYLLGQYANPDSLISAASNISTTIALYNFLQKAKVENYDKEIFRHRLEILVGRPRQDADSLYSKIFELRDLGNDLFNDRTIFLNRIDMEIKKITTEAILTDLKPIIDSVRKAREDMRVYQWQRKSPIWGVIKYFSLALITMTVIWMAILNVTFNRNSPTSKPVVSSEMLEFGNQKHRIISDFNSCDEAEDYIDDIETIYNFQKRTISDLRNKINRLNYKIERK